MKLMLPLELWLKQKPRPKRSLLWNRAVLLLNKNAGIAISNLMIDGRRTPGPTPMGQRPSQLVMYYAHFTVTIAYNFTCGHDDMHHLSCIYFFEVVILSVWPELGIALDVFMFHGKLN